MASIQRQSSANDRNFPDDPNLCAFEPLERIIASFYIEMRFGDDQFHDPSLLVEPTIAEQALIRLFDQFG